MEGASVAPGKNRYLVLLVFLVFCSLGQSAFAQNDPEKIVTEQLEAYNNRDLEAFLSFYSDSVKIYNYPDEFLYTGKETLRKNYGALFLNKKDLNCIIKSRVVLNNTVIDHELVLIDKGQPRFEAVAIYHINEGKIEEVRFMIPGN